MSLTTAPSTDHCRKLYTVADDAAAGGIPVLITVWLIAATGSFNFLYRSFPKLSTVMYVLMGWVIVIALKPLIKAWKPRIGLCWPVDWPILLAQSFIKFKD